jgi:hypothetical protein
MWGVPRQQQQQQQPPQQQVLKRFSRMYGGEGWVSQYLEIYDLYLLVVDVTM